MTVPAAPTGDRAVWRSLRRGFVGRCPACGAGPLFGAYLKVRDHCERCGEPLHHHRADDAPAYVTVLIVAHIVGAAMLAVLSADEEMPLWLQAILWPALVIGLGLGLLPRIKGAVVALQWALRMHGFEDGVDAEKRELAPGCRPIAETWDAGSARFAAPEGPERPPA